MEKKIVIALGADHAGYLYKDMLIKELSSLGYECINLGPDTGDSVDYPTYAKAVCEKVVSKEADFGILVCGTGIGMSMAANKVKGIRAALCSETVSASLTRQHNNANVLCMGARMIGEVAALEIAKTFITTDFLGGRHQRRVDIVDNMI